MYSIGLLLTGAVLLVPSSIYAVRGKTLRNGMLGVLSVCFEAKLRCLCCGCIVVMIFEGQVVFDLCCVD